MRSGVSLAENSAFNKNTFHDMYRKDRVLVAGEISNNERREGIV